MTNASFGQRLRQAVTSRGRLCVGIDPHPPLLHAWGLSDSAAGAREFGLRVVAAAAGLVGVVKPQVAFFERHGAAGLAALEEVMAAARSAGLLVVADAKRGDIGSTMNAYAQAWLRPGSPLEADALTVSPYLGVGALDQAAAAALQHGKGLFVLAATSNPEAAGLQRATDESGMTVAARVCTQVRARDQTDASTWPSLGVVVGATLQRAEFGLSDRILEGMPILAPGFGHQGAKLTDVDDLFGLLAPRVLACASRSILSAGPDGLAEAIRTHRRQLED